MLFLTPMPIQQRQITKRQRQKRTKDVLPNIHHTQAAVSMHSRHCLTRRLRHGPVCCPYFATYNTRLTVHYQWEWLSIFSFFCPWWPWPLTLTLKLVRARDQTRLHCEFGANPFTVSRDIGKQTNKKYAKTKTRRVTDCAKNRTLLACGN